MPIKSLVLAAALATATLPAGAAVIFQDGFDTDNAGTVLNFSGLANWTVGDGTIDYIRSGGYGIDCVGDTGGCLDMDGSTSNAGRITSRQIFTFDAGTDYFIDIALSGNQRDGASDSVVFGLVNADTGGLLQTTVGALAPGAPFDVFTSQYLGSALAGSNWRLFVEGVGGDNIGAILDNYVLRDDASNSVAEPATVALLGLGLAGLAASRRRRQ